MNRSEKLGNLIPALIAAQQEFPPIEANKFVDAGRVKYHYAEWDKIVPLIRPILNSHGFAIVQAAKDVPGRVVVETVLLHMSDEWISDEFGIAIADNAAPQAYGSALSYVKRYSFVSLLNAVVGGEDDDAARAGAARDRNQSNGWNREDRARKEATEEISRCMTVEALHEWWKENQESVNALSPDTMAQITLMVSARHKELTGGPAASPKAMAPITPPAARAPAAPRSPATPTPIASQPKPMQVTKVDPPSVTTPPAPKPALTLSKPPAQPAPPDDDFGGFGNDFPG